MLTNAMTLMIYHAQKHLKNPDAPILFVHQVEDGPNAGEMWQIVVSRAPRQEVMAA